MSMPSPPVENLTGVRSVMDSPPPYPEDECDLAAAFTPEDHPALF
jgi:hypothetical protein